MDINLEELTNFRHRLHMIAEISGDEKETSTTIADFLKSTSPDNLQTEVGGHGLFATYEGGKEGPHVVIRCELDALPIADNIDKDYQSQSEGVGHKCGHDGHMTMVCGVAQMLEKHPPKSGKITLLFQPAEEIGEGAQSVIEDPEFQELSPDYCFALHNLPGFKKNEIVVREGVFAAASVGLIISLKGSTAHAAHPEQGESPALAMAQIIQALSAAPQFYSPLDRAAKVTVINANLGEQAFGTSPGQATVMATLRTYEEDLLDTLKEKCIRLAEQTAQVYDLAVDYEWVEYFPSTVNNSEANQTVTSAAEKQNYTTHPKEHPFSWSEDFGYFTNEIKGAMFGLGAGESHPTLHAENYDFPDDVISTGVSMFIEIINEVTSR